MVELLNYCTAHVCPIRCLVDWVFPGNVTSPHWIRIGWHVDVRRSYRWLDALVAVSNSKTSAQQHSSHKPWTFLLRKHTSAPREMMEMGSNSVLPDLEHSLNSHQPQPACWGKSSIRFCRTSLAPSPLDDRVIVFFKSGLGVSDARVGFGGKYLSVPHFEAFHFGSDKLNCYNTPNAPCSHPLWSFQWHPAAWRWKCGTHFKIYYLY